jgi:hypothetical protein
LSGTSTRVRQFALFINSERSRFEYMRTRFENTPFTRSRNRRKCVLCGIPSCV